MLLVLPVPRYGPNPLTRNLETTKWTKCPAEALGPQPPGRLTPETSRRHGGIGCSRRRSSVRPRTKGLPRQVSSPVHCRTPPRTPACAPPHLHQRTAATAARQHTVITYTPAGLTLELELGLLGGPRLSKLPNHAGQTLPHYAAAAAAPAGRSATMRGGGLTYPASIGAAAKPRHTARRSPRVGWAVSAQGWPRASPDMVEPVNAQRSAKPTAAPTPQPQPQQPRMRQPSPSKGKWQPQQQQPSPQQQQQRRQQASRPSSATPTVSARPVAAARHHSHRAAAAARPQSAAMHRPNGAGTAVVRPQSAGGNNQRPQSAGVDTPRRAAVVRPQSASERRAETAEREQLLGVSGNRALMLCATIVVVSVVIVGIGHRAHRQLPTPTVAASSVL